MIDKFIIPFRLIIFIGILFLSGCAVGTRLGPLDQSNFKNILERDTQIHATDIQSYETGVWAPNAKGFCSPLLACALLTKFEVPNEFLGLLILTKDQVHVVTWSSALSKYQRGISINRLEISEVEVIEFGLNHRLVMRIDHKDAIASTAEFHTFTFVKNDAMGGLDLQAAYRYKRILSSSSENTPKL